MTMKKGEIRKYVEMSQAWLRQRAVQVFPISPAQPNL